MLWKTVLCCAQPLSRVQLFATPWTVAPQALLSVGILQARILEWAAMPSSRGSSQPRIKPRSPALQAASLPSEPPGKPRKLCQITQKDSSRNDKVTDVNKPCEKLELNCLMRYVNRKMKNLQIKIFHCNMIKVCN